MGAKLGFFIAGKQTDTKADPLVLFVSALLMCVPFFKTGQFSDELIRLHLSLSL